MAQSDFETLARKYNISIGAIETLAQAIQRGHGTAAQFNHPELGGMGQWMPGSIMIGDMFNHTLKAKVALLCDELAGIVRLSTSTQPFNTFTYENWWPKNYGAPTFSGSQNQMGYAYFASVARLAILRDNTVQLYNTTGYALTGVAQQQAAAIQTLAFLTPEGVITADRLPRVES